MGQKIVQFAGFVADEMGEHLALLLSLQIGAGGRSRQVKLRRIARVLCHVRPFVSGQPDSLPSIAPGRPGGQLV